MIYSALRQGLAVEEKKVNLVKASCAAALLVMGSEAWAQKAYVPKEHDIYWIARVVYGEARGESYEGQCLVAWSMLFRYAADLPEFGGADFKAIARKYNPKNGRWQYDGIKVAVTDEGAWQTARRVALDALMGRCVPRKPVMYFCMPEACKGWHDNGATYAFTKGTHQFYTDKRYPGKREVATNE